jgi:ABC-type multidrug transport system ATPase subunit
VKAVKDVTLTLYNGEIFALLGHNGAGKTTCLNMLYGMLTPTGGNAIVLKKDIRTDLDYIR